MPAEDLPPVEELPPVKPEYRTAPEATIINAVRSATIASEVSGIIEIFAFDEGDFIQEGEVVVEISPRRFALLAKKASDAHQGAELAVARAEQQVKLLRELLTQDATTRQELLKAETDRDVAQSRAREARADVELARLNLEDCRITAPFSGYLAVRFKQPFEAVERFEKIFTIVDSSSVYAVANVPEELLPVFGKGSEAFFLDSAGRTFAGKVERVGKLIDPKSRTKKVFVLINNSEAGLEVGMTGSLRSGKPGEP